MVQTQMVWSAEPEAVYRAGGDHLLNGVERPRIAHAKLSGEVGCCLGVLSVWAVDSEHISIAHAEPRLNMKARDESTSYESYSQLVCGHRIDSSCKCFSLVVGYAKPRPHGRGYYIAALRASIFPRANFLELFCWCARGSVADDHLS